MNKTKKPTLTLADLNRIKRQLGIESTTIYRDASGYWIDWNGTIERFRSARCVERALRKASE